MENDKIDLRTPLQRKREERNKKICEDYFNIMNNLPDKATPWAIWRTLGERYGMKAQGIRAIINKFESVKNERH